MDLGKNKTRDKILQSTIALISSQEEIESITTRQIAQEAGVNPALINYHFQSKENLFNEAVGIQMANIIQQVLDSSQKESDPVRRLKELLITTADYSFRHNKIFKVGVADELKQGCRNSCEMAMPMLKEIFPEMNRTELRIIALQLFLPFHNIVLYPEVYGEYLGADFFDQEERAQIIQQMTDSILAL